MITGILLAAGSAKRFGTQKLLERLPNGQAIGLASAQALLPAVDNMIVVVKPEDKALQELFDRENITTVICERASLGISESIKVGINTAPQANGWLIALGDMPFIQTETISTLVELMARGHGIVHPSYQQKRGHPVGFSQDYAEELILLQGDKGAKDILLRHPSAIKVFHCEDRGIVQDIDTHKQLASYQ